MNIKSCDVILDMTNYDTALLSAKLVSCISRISYILKMLVQLYKLHAENICSVCFLFI